MTSPNDPSPNDIWKSLAEAKWVRIMADFCANGIWHQDGRMAAFDDLPVAESLKERIRHWQERHDRENCDHIDRDDPRWRPWDVAGFAAEGREIARALKAALPDWTVVYVDESRRDRSRDFQSRSEIEYEILLPAVPQSFEEFLAGFSLYAAAWKRDGKAGETWYADEKPYVEGRSLRVYGGTKDAVLWALRRCYDDRLSRLNRDCSCASASRTNPRPEREPATPKDDMYTPATADPGPRYVAGATPTGRVEIRDSFGAHPDVVLAPAEAERLALRLIWAAAKAREAAPDGPDAESPLLPRIP